MTAPPDDEPPRAVIEAPLPHRLRATTFADDDRAAIRFILRLARALHRYGTPSHRLEDALAVVARQLGVTAEVFTTPTTLILSFGEPAALRTRMLRVEGAGLDVGRLAAVDALASDVIARRISPDEGLARIDAIEAAPAIYGRITTIAANVVSAGAFAVFFGGALADVIAAAVIGLVVGLLGLVMQRSSNQARVYEVSAAGLAAFAAVALAARWPVNPSLVTVAALLVLLPGMTLTTAMTELATRNLIAGTARMMSAVIVLLQLVVGVALGQRLAQAVFVVHATVPAPLPAWAPWVALAASAVAMTVVVQAQPRALGWIVAACALGYVGTHAGTEWLGGTGDPLGDQLGVAVGAFALGVLANAYARWLDRPAQVVLVPATILLVPGSMGLRGMTSLLDRHTLTGVDTMFAMFVTAMAIVGGLLLANATVSPRRVL
ncbi:MAG: threonine/serine exporter family protein [Kofleriaceae bacterium]